MSLFKSLITENPMLIEIVRFRRKFLGAGSSSVNTVLVVLSGLIYLGLVMVVWSNRSSANPMFMVLIQTGIFTLLAPAMLHGSIAGERERRSWDFLLVAPVTQAQIVFGKFLSAASAILACTALFLIPTAIGLIFYEPYNYMTSQPDSYGLGNYWNLLLAEIVSVTWGLVLCAMTIFFSARAKRGFIALGTTLAMMIAALIVWPILVLSAGIMGQSAGFLNFFHPFWVLTQIESANRPYGGEEFMLAAYGFPQILTYIGMTAVFLYWAERTVRFADNDVKFIPKQNDA